MLERRPNAARFVSEVAAALQPRSFDEIERTLADLEQRGKVIVREGNCAVPHLETVDLRVVCLVTRSDDGSDPQSRAIAAIDDVWNAWLGDYLSNHRCG
jgi:hypothetical protein